MNQVKLTAYSRSAGCGCKVPPAVLNAILQDRNAKTLFPNLLVGNDRNDDAAVMDIGNGNALISTTDFFMPIVDDPYDFGRIAAANAISDVYAMGGKPIMAIAVLGWPVEKLAPEIASQVLKGGEKICKEAGIPMAGGHSIDSPEPFFGLAVNGIIEISNIKRNSTAKEGDHLFITKPIGTGILATALKRGLILQEESIQLLELMVELNKIGEELGKLKGVNAMTDITGFGLLGHLHEMAEGSNLTAVVMNENVTLIEGAEKYAKQFCFPDNTTRNLNNYKKSIEGMNDLEFITLCDPQTNGGILVSVAPDSLKAYMEIAGKSKYAALAMRSIGKMEAKKDKIIQVI
jgi:selenide, water dikinase